MKNQYEIKKVNNVRCVTKIKFNRSTKKCEMCYGKSFLLKNTKQNVNNVTQCSISWIFVEMCYENDRAYER